MKPLLTLTIPLFALLPSSCLFDNDPGPIPVPKAFAAEYEILAVPKSSSFYPVGSSWKLGLGPDGPNRAIVIEADGLSSIGSSDKKGFEAGLSTKVTQFLQGQFNLQPSSIQSLKIENLKHRRVQSLQDTSTKGLVLWETIEGSRINFTVAEGNHFGGDTVMSEGLVKEVPNARLTIRRDSASTYQLTSDRPLVFAYRLVEVDYQQSQAVVPVTQTGSTSKLGYVVTQLGPEDIVSQSVRVLITNPDLIGWAGETVTLGPGKVWENKGVRQAIGQNDPLAKNADFIWDTILLQWAPTRQAVITRQYGVIKPTR